MEILNTCDDCGSSDGLIFKHTPRLLIEGTNLCRGCRRDVFINGMGGNEETFEIMDAAMMEKYAGFEKRWIDGSMPVGCARFHEMPTVIKSGDRTIIMGNRPDQRAAAQKYRRKRNRRRRRKR